MALSESERHPDILVLGGGPAGLSLGHELKRRGLSFLILERGATVGESWRRMPSNLKLVSPWKANCLPGTRPSLRSLHHEISREEFFRYLQDYAQAHALPVRRQVEVRAVVKTPDQRFCVQTSEGVFTSRQLVNATGCFWNPFVPPIPGAAESTLPQLHFADYENPGHVKQLLGDARSPVLIVGKRLSAGQALVELVDAGLEVALSHRSPIRFGSGPVGWWLFFRLLPELEALKLKLHGPAARGFEVRMPGGRARQLIRRGTVKTFPGIRRFAGRAVEFENGVVLQPALVLYATGFRPALDHLRPLLDYPRLHQLECVSVPDLFF